jgi:SAM-dependent methyltransferase
VSLSAEGDGISVELGSGILSGVYSKIEAYYSARVAKYGATPLGVDWSCQATQGLRFVQLLKLCDFSAPFSLNDIGCGYGALATFLAARYPDSKIDYLGLDLSRNMIRRARRRFSRSGHRFVVGVASPRIADYSVASGIMNVNCSFSRAVWEGFVATTLREMRRMSRHGFSVNFISDAPNAGTSADHSVDILYRTNPEPWVRYCERELGCCVETIDDYGMKEFTLLVRCNPIAAA